MTTAASLLAACCTSLPQANRSNSRGRLGEPHWLQRSGVPVTPETLPERTNEHTKEYASTVVELGRELQLPVLDLWTLMQQHPGWQDKLLCDGLHFTSEGNRFVYKHLQNLINEAFPELR